MFVTCSRTAWVEVLFSETRNLMRWMGVGFEFLVTTCTSNSHEAPKYRWARGGMEVADLRIPWQRPESPLRTSQPPFHLRSNA